MASSNALALPNPNPSDPEETSTREIRDLRAQIQEPPVIAEQPWLLFNPARARVKCNPGKLAALDRVTKECKADFGKAAPAVWRSLMFAMVPALAQNQTPFIQEQLAKIGLENRGNLKTLQDIADTAGVPLSAVTCLIKGAVRLSLGDSPVTEDVIDSLNAATDIYQLFGALKAGLSGARAWLDGKGAADLMGQTGGNTVRQQVRDMADLADTTVGPVQSPGWFERIVKPIAESSLIQMASLESSAVEAKQKFEQCEVDAALAIQTEIPAAARKWAEGWRNFIEHMEIQKFCADTGVASVIFYYADADADWKNSNQSYKGHIQDLNQQGVLDPPWARPDSVAAKRQLVEELEERLARVHAFDTTTPAAPCDVDAALEDLKWLLLRQECLDGIEGYGAAERLKRAMEPLRELDFALDSMQELVVPAESEAQSRIDSCDLETWSEPLDRAEEEFNRLYGTQWKLSDLQQCWDGDWPFDALKEKAREREEELTGLISGGRGLIDEARNLIGECRFDEVQEKLNTVDGLIYQPQCDLDSVVCADGGADSHRCRLLALLETLDLAQIEFGEKQTQFDEAMVEVASIGDELLEYGRGELERARVIAPERCVALVQVAEAATDLETLQLPLECPGDSPYMEEAAGLRLEADQLAADFEGALSELAAQGNTATEACDLEGLTAIQQEVATREAAACPARSELTPQFAKVLEDWEREVEEARSILTESSADLDVWMGACDVSALHSIAGREMLLSKCGLLLLDDQARERAAFLMHIHDLAPALQAEAQSADAYLKNAETYIEAAKRELDVDTDPDVEHQAAAINLDKARASLEKAHTAASKIKVGQYMPQSCVRHVLDRIAAIEASMPEIPSVDQQQELEPEPERVVVPGLVGEEGEFAAAWLEDVGLKAVIRKEHEIPETGQRPAPRTVIGQLPSGGVERSRGDGVLLWVYEPATTSTTTSTTNSAGNSNVQPTAQVQITPEYCTSRWRGTKVVRLAGGALDCDCPAGSAWSKVKKTCLKIGAMPTQRVTNCNHMDGTIRNPVTGQCECPAGDWSSTRGRCVDTAAADREREIGESRKAASCESLFTEIQILRGNPEPLYQQMADRAERKAQAQGCDSSRIRQANDDGRATPRGQQPAPGGETRSTMSGHCTGAITASPAAGYVGDGLTVTIVINPPESQFIAKVTTDNPRCHTCNAPMVQPGRFVYTGYFDGPSGGFTVTFIAYDQDGVQRCSGATGTLQVLGPRR
ncbi:MAG: hypothetical protein GY906_09630 [bacterium]|nr:hypothetical protein [bacterium]